MEPSANVKAQLRATIDLERNGQRSEAVTASRRCVDELRTSCGPDDQRLDDSLALAARQCLDEGALNAAVTFQVSVLEHQMVWRQGMGPTVAECMRLLSGIYELARRPKIAALLTDRAQIAEGGAKVDPSNSPPIFTTLATIRASFVAVAGYSSFSNAQGMPFWKQAMKDLNPCLYELLVEVGTIAFGVGVIPGETPVDTFVQQMKEVLASQFAGCLCVLQAKTYELSDRSTGREQKANILIATFLTATQGKEGQFLPSGATLVPFY